MGWRQAVTAFWETRSARERGVLASAAAIALIAALYGLLWDPGLKATARLDAALPLLRAQVEDMRQQQKEIALLRKSSGTASPAADVGALLRASAARSPLAAAAPSIEGQPGGRVLFAAAAADFDAWLHWVGAVQRELGIRLESCHIAALEQPGRVRIQATFAAGKGQAPR